MGSEIIIKAQYDSAFSFNKGNQLAMVCSKNLYNLKTNPLSGLEEIQLDYFYIDSSNKKIKLKANNFPDSVSVFENQFEFQKQYLDTNSVFKLLFQNKVYLFSKKGVQLSKGFDNIIECKNRQFFIIENNSVFDHNIVKVNGLIDTTGRELINCKYKHITFNNEDSCMYCCSAVFSNKQNDDVYDYHGKLIFTDRKHISFSSKQIHVMKLYDPKPSFLIENEKNKTSKTLIGNEFHYLGHNNALIVDDDNWYIVNMITFDRKKIKKENFNKSLFTIFGI